MKGPQGILKVLATYLLDRLDLGRCQKFPPSFIRPHATLESALEFLRICLDVTEAFCRGQYRDSGAVISIQTLGRGGLGYTSKHFFRKWLQAFL